MAMETVGRPIRFVAVGLDLEEGVADVASPPLTITSDVVEEALRNAETLISDPGLSSHLDRYSKDLACLWAERSFSYCHQTALPPEASTLLPASPEAFNLVS